MKPGSLPTNRKDKIRFLNELRERRISLNDFPEPITGMVLIHNGEYWDMKTGKQISKHEKYTSINRHLYFFYFF